MEYTKDSMKRIETESLRRKKSMPKSELEKTLPSGLEKQSAMQNNQVTSESLPKSVSLQLYDLMNRVVETEVTPQTVNAACSCASEIHKILKLNFEMKKQGF